MHYRSIHRLLRRNHGYAHINLTLLEQPECDRWVYVSYLETLARVHLVGSNPACSSPATPFADLDEDGVPDHRDLYPHLADHGIDTDLDGTPDNTDLDDDNDQVPDSEDPHPFDPTLSADRAYLANLSTRGSVGTGDSVLIAGAIVSGSQPVQTLIRGRGPSLAGFVPNPLPTPAVSTQIPGGPVHPGASFISSEVYPRWLWPALPDDVAFRFPAHESLPFTAILSDANGASGIGIIELFDHQPIEASRLVNISTRGQVGTADNVLIGGFIIEGSRPLTVLLRGRGPSMAAAGVEGTLPDPMLSLFNESGEVIHSNNNWQDDASATGMPAGLAPTDPLESAMMLELPPAAYTAIVSGRDGMTGIGIVEVLDVD